MQELKLLQINLHKSKTASAELLLRLEERGYDAALVQEPWIASGNEVSGIKSRSFHTYFPDAQNKVRTAMLVSKNVNSYFISNLSTDSLTVVVIEGGRDEPTLLASYYMSHDAEAPPQELQKLVRQAGERKQPFVVGTDANAHRTLWGSSDLNGRGESLFFSY